MNSQIYHPFDPSEILQINAGFFHLRRILDQTAPTDFECGFLMTGPVFVLSWASRPNFEYQQEFRAPTLLEALQKWRAINWPHERRRARECVRLEVAS